MPKYILFKRTLTLGLHMCINQITTFLFSCVTSQKFYSVTDNVRRKTGTRFLEKDMCLKL